MDNCFDSKEQQLRVKNDLLHYWSGLMSAVNICIIVSTETVVVYLSELQQLYVTSGDS
jgi:hypothetical protein